jgi:signal transduction histidine kinase
VKNIERFLATARRVFENVGTWVAGFTFWRFVLFSILVLVATNIIGGLLFKSGEPVVAVSTHRPAETRTDIPRPSAPEGQGKIPPAPTPPKVATDPEGSSKCHEDVQVHWTGVHVRTVCNGHDVAVANDLADAEADLADEDLPTGHSKLKDWMLAVLAVLWIMWFVGRARQKAEVRADRAEAAAEREGLERQVAEARLQALQAQVEPHFLFNTLGAVEHLIETDPPRAATMQRHLIAFLRGAMPRMRSESVTLGDEIELCRNYLAIMKIRMEDRLDFNIDLPPELAGAGFPPMMLQSVVENAIKHGLEPKATGGSLLISARAAAGRLRVAVTDSGLGFGGADTAGTGIGLNNIRERLAGLFGDKAALVITPNAPTGAQVVIEIPYDSGNRNHR